MKAWAPRIPATRKANLELSSMHQAYQHHSACYSICQTTLRNSQLERNFRVSVCMVRSLVESLSRPFEESSFQEPFWRITVGDIFFMKVTSVLEASDSEPRGLRFRGGEHPPPKKNNSESSSGPFLRSWIKKKYTRRSQFPFRQCWFNRKQCKPQMLF